MLTKEIQKNILPDQTPKRQKKSPLFSLKKSNKKNCLQSQEKKQKKAYFQKKLKRFHKSKINLDDISLETNSTINTLEEENFFTNEEQLRYFKEIEFVMKDICEKGFYSVENLEKLLLEKKIENDEIKKGNVKYLNQNYKNFFENISPNEKIKLILDIDETLVYSQVLQEIQYENLKNIGSYQNPEIQNLGQDEYLIQIFEKNQEKYFIVRVKIRKGLTLFFKKLFPFCEFYINTMASKPYVLEILKILEKDYDFFIKEEKVICTHPQSKKILDEKIKNEENFLILDDNICAWEMAYIPSIIPVKKFNEIKEINNVDIFYQYYLFSNKIYCFNEAKSCFVYSAEKIPLCVEVTKNEKNSKNKLSQLNQIAEIIIKSFILKKIVHFPIRHCLHFIQNTILKNCKIFYQGFEQNFISEMILLLGGTVINDINYIQEATHIIYNENLVKNSEKKLKNNCDKYNINIKWIFDCFFKFKKCEENSDEYQI